MATTQITITVSENLGMSRSDPCRFCATTEDAEMYDMGGFGATEAEALADLAGQVGLSDRDLAAATIERMAMR